MMVETSESVMLEMRTQEVDQLRQELAGMRLRLDQYEVYCESLKSELSRLNGILQVEYACSEEDLGSSDL